MEAKDTVMRNKELQLLGQEYEDNPPTCDFTHYALERQAEISFRAGQKEGRKGMFLAGDNNGYLRGIKEVVEWINGNGGWILNYKTTKQDRIWNWAITHDQWQAKLKEWGI